MKLTAFFIFLIPMSLGAQAQQVEPLGPEQRPGALDALTMKAANDQLNRLLESAFAKQQLQYVQNQLRHLESLPEAQIQKAALEADLLTLQSDAQVQERIQAMRTQLRELEASPERRAQTVRLQSDLKKEAAK